MNKIFSLILLLSLSLGALEIPTKHATKKVFNEKVELNAQIVQLSNASGSIMSVLGGHIEKYYVKIGQSIKKGQKVVLIESIKLSKMTAEYLSLKKQFTAQEKNFNATNKLYEKGMTSMSALNEQSIKKDALSADLTALKSQLNTLGIDTQRLKKTSSSFVLYAHSAGVVSAILQALHTSVQEDTPIISMVQNEVYYLKSFLPTKYASKVKIGQKIVFRYADKSIVSHITQILPRVDSSTQRIVLLSSIDEKVSHLYIDTYVGATLYFGAKDKYVAVEKSALSFFKNEWVVFIPIEEEHEGHEEQEEHHDELEQHDEHEHEDEHHDEHEEESEGHEEHEAKYEVRVVEIITQDDNFVALKGIEVGEEYVNDKSYYVKSMMLKSSLGGHGH